MITKKGKNELMSKLQSLLYNHQINIMDIGSLTKLAENYVIQGNAINIAASKAFDEFKNNGKIKVSSASQS